MERKTATKEQESSLGSMYVFIEFGRLGCKHVIYLGDVYVLCLDLHVAYTHTCVSNAICTYDYVHFGSSIHVEQF